MTTLADDAVTLACTRCGDWIDLPPPPGPDTHQRSVEAAGWYVGDGQVLCPACLLRGACETFGHHWGRWTTLGPSLDGRWATSRARHCRVCTAGEFEPCSAR